MTVVNTYASLLHMHLNSAEYSARICHLTLAAVLVTEVMAIVVLASGQIHFLLCYSTASWPYESLQCNQHLVGCVGWAKGSMCSVEECYCSLHRLHMPLLY